MAGPWSLMAALNVDVVACLSIGTLLDGFRLKTGSFKATWMDGGKLEGMTDVATSVMPDGVDDSRQDE
jgi:hypothetical protein